MKRSWSGRLLGAASQQQRNPGSELLACLLRLYAERKLTANDFHTLCWWCTKAEVAGADFE
eukprot:12900109-Prorocentrum_lima.AAC.1